MWNLDYTHYIWHMLVHILCIWLDTINGEFIATHANHRNALLINIRLGWLGGVGEIYIQYVRLFRNYNYDKLLVHKF